MAQTKNGDPTDQKYEAVGAAPELQSGEMLLVEAYAAFWLILLVFVGVMFARTRKMEGQLATLVTALAKARERDEASAKARPKPASTGSASASASSAASSGGQEG